MKEFEKMDLARGGVATEHRLGRREHRIVVEMGDLKVTSAPDAVLVTHALGSCVGVAMYDREARVAGLLHCQLPTSSINQQRALERPGMFADTGLAALLQAVLELGGQKRRLSIKLAGAAQMLGDDKLFNIGRRNYAAVRKALWLEGLLIDREDVGGNLPRTMFVHVADGTVLIKSGDQTSRL
jgi:chemotaxis protein CheD